MKGKLFKTGISMLLASAMMITSIPATNLSAAEPKAGETPVLDSAGNLQTVRIRRLCWRQLEMVRSQN